MEKFIFTPRLLVIIAAISIAVFLPIQNAESQNPNPCPNNLCFWNTSQCIDAAPEYNTMCMDAIGSPEDCMGSMSCPEPH